MNTRIDIDYFKSIFASFDFNVSNVKGFNSDCYFIADNGFFVVFCKFYGDYGYQPVLAAVTYLSADKESVIKTALELKEFPDIYNTDYFIKGDVKIVNLLHNHDYSPAEVVSALNKITEYIKKYYSFKLK